MADLLQGSALPSTPTIAQTQQTVPEFYTNYLQDIANLGQNAVTSGGVAGFSPLQQQAFQMAPQAALNSPMASAKTCSTQPRTGRLRPGQIASSRLTRWAT